MAARWLTFALGLLGTLFALVFVDQGFRSLFDTFLVVIGLFMGVLGGLFILGVATRRANATGAMIGAVLGAAVMFCLWRFTALNGLLYTTCGIVACVCVGYITSLLTGPPTNDLTGLTLHSCDRVISAKIEH
jgi:Na+/proline symporter